MCVILIQDQDKAENAGDAFRRLWCAPAAMLEAALARGARMRYKCAPAAMLEAAALAIGARAPSHPMR
jgi:hypothetical protein